MALLLLPKGGWWCKESVAHESIPAREALPTSSSGSFEKRFEAATKLVLMQKPIPEDELIEEDGPQNEALSRLLPLRRHLSMPLKKGFELLIPRLDRS